MKKSLYSFLCVIIHFGSDVGVQDKVVYGFNTPKMFPVIPSLSEKIREVLLINIHFK